MSAALRCAPQQRHPMAAPADERFWFHDHQSSASREANSRLKVAIIPRVESSARRRARQERSGWHITSRYGIAIWDRTEFLRSTGVQRRQYLCPGVESLPSNSSTNLRPGDGSRTADKMRHDSPRDFVWGHAFSNTVFARMACVNRTPFRSSCQSCPSLTPGGSGSGAVCPGANRGMTLNEGPKEDSMPQ